MTNIELFEYSGQHREQMLDPAYLDDSDPIIPKTTTERHHLVEENAKLLKSISAFAFYIQHGRQLGDPDVEKLITGIIDILAQTKELHFSPFSQFFMVYDSSYASFCKYGIEEQREFIRKMLCCYCERRHTLYCTHGYTNSMLQVVSDSYSHKRKSIASINKIRKILDAAGFVHSSTLDENKRFYFLPDKVNKQTFDLFKQQHNVAMEFVKNKQGKLPDIVFFNNGEYYIAELKHVNGNGGGQDKQVSEIIDFIKYPEPNNEHIHYVSYLDGDYSNLLHDSENRKKKKNGKYSKIGNQYRSIRKLLRKYAGYYFLNTAGFEMLIQQLVNSVTD